MLESLSVVVVVLAFLVWALAFVGKNAPRTTRAVTPPPAPKQIPPALQAELDRTPTWWTDQFHKALRATGAPSVGGEEWELMTFSGPVYMHREVGYRECPCRECRRICR